MRRSAGRGGGGCGLPGRPRPAYLGPGAGASPRPAEPGEQLQPPPVRLVETAASRAGQDSSSTRAAVLVPGRAGDDGRAARGRGRPRGPRRGPGPRQESGTPRAVRASPRRRARRSWPAGEQAGAAGGAPGQVDPSPAARPPSRREGPYVAELVDDDSVPAGAEANSASSLGLLLRTGRWPAPPRRGRSGRPSAMTCRRPGRARPRALWMALYGGILPVVVRPDGPPRHHITSRGTARHSLSGRVPRRQHPTGPLGGRDVRPCAGARSAARSGRASIVAQDGPGLTISTVMDVLK